MGNAFRQGEHICSLYETEDEQLTMAAEYLSDGLRAGERAFYVAESRQALNRFDLALKRVGIDVAAALRKRALIQFTHDQAHLSDGSFDSERMLRLLNDEVEAALNDGFTGLRTCGDMSWLLLDPPGAEQVVEYEALLNQFFQGVRASGMCQYGRRRLSADLVDHALATHSSAFLEGHHKPNPFYRPPAIAISRSPQGSEIGWKLGELRRRS